MTANDTMHSAHLTLGAPFGSGERFLIRLFVIACSYFLISLIPLPAQEYPDQEQLFHEAERLSKPILLVFSGSDWCAPCIAFERKVLSKEPFQEFVRDQCVFVRADFPQRATLPRRLVEQNEALAEQYNPKGEFPLVLLINPDGKPLATLGHNGVDDQTFIENLQEFLPEIVQEHAENREFHRSARLMGSSFEFTLVADDSLEAERLLDECLREVERIEYRISEWIDTTEVSRLNGMAGRSPMKVSSELYQLIRRSLNISLITQGAFDISFASLGTLWNFNHPQSKLPDSASVLHALENIGYDKITMLDSSRVYLEESGMKIGFGSIGKGYAADRVKSLMLERGVRGGVINASGDLIAWGTRPNGTPWKVGIADPENREEMKLWLPLENVAIATSGDYEKFFLVDGVRYSHIIDPRTGYPARGVRSTSVISRSAELSDALATAIFVLGKEVGIDLINQLPDVECIIVDDENRIHYSGDLDVRISQDSSYGE